MFNSQSAPSVDSFSLHGTESTGTDDWYKVYTKNYYLLNKCEAWYWCGSVWDGTQVGVEAVCIDIS